MKINISKVKVTPNNIREHCAVYVVTDEILEWINKNNLEAVKHEKGYLNIFIENLADRYEDLFSVDNSFTYFDGFSPNLNKSLHLGHLSNLIYASAISNLCPKLKAVSILNDTDNDPKKDSYYEEYKQICLHFNYVRYKDCFSSDMLLFDNFNFNIFMSEDDKYAGCIAVETPKTLENKILVKKDGSTTYLNQDLYFAKELYYPILYLTGAEQMSHFEVVREFYPENKHLAIGLITAEGEKMSSRKGNVIFLKEVLYMYEVNTLKDTFLKYNLSTFKNDIKIEVGLSEKLEDGDFKKFDNEKLYLIYLVAQNSYNPSLLYNTLKNESINDVNFGLRLLGYKFSAKKK